MKRIAPAGTVKEALGWVEEKIGGLTILSVFFIFFGVVQVLGAQTTIVTPSGSVNVGIGLWRIIFAAIFLASGISLWTRRLWSWALAILTTLLISVVGF
ncbi:hypothetical protein AKJ50_01795 [candidate division MSBL1 archaeon SCGC-AAA382A13]|uniref:Uncharacterized protein n=1 Tax=candidate division MSBL1 archaeon SCGC-AAA382A13 TaxID=1698279 RepID=A0A133VEY0_9EURY|nr:hypothetical protein AKJ50_01795 [candidate division MSBL1 archaeon SCGC-AAA382A13]